MRQSTDSQGFQKQHFDRLYDLLIGPSIHIETQLINTAIQNHGRVEKQIEDIQAILNDHRMKTLQNVVYVIQNLINQGDSQQNVYDFQQIVEQHTAKYTQKQLLLQMKNVLNHKILSKLELLNKIAEQDKSTILTELDTLSLSLEKVTQALSQMPSPWNFEVIGEGFSVLKDLQNTTREEEKQNNYERNIQMNNEYSIQQQNQNIEADESNLYAEETESVHETTQNMDQYATQRELQLHQNNENQPYLSYQKKIKDEIINSNLKLITPNTYKMHSFGYKTEPDSGMTPLLSEDSTKNNMYKTPQDNNNRNMIKNNNQGEINQISHNNNLEQNRIENRLNEQEIINNVISSDQSENSNNIISSSNPTETLSAGDLISPHITTQNNRLAMAQDCTSFNKSEESSKFTNQFNISGERDNQNNYLTFGNNNFHSTNLPHNSNSSHFLFQNKLQNSKNVQTQQELPNQSKLIDMFDACLNSLQQPELMENKNFAQENKARNIIVEEERLNESTDEFILHEKNVNENSGQVIQQGDEQTESNFQNQSKAVGQIEKNKFGEVNISNVVEAEEIKVEDNSFFSQKQSPFYPFDDKSMIQQKEQKYDANYAHQSNPSQFVSTFGMNFTPDDQQNQFLENKFGKDHFEIDTIAFESELESKISALKKQLFSTSVLENFTPFINSENINQKNTDTIKPVLQRKDELEALGEQNNTEFEQFKIQEEDEQQLNDSQENGNAEYIKNSNKNSSSKKIAQKDTNILNQNQRKSIFDESNKFYDTLDNETTKFLQNKNIQQEQFIESIKNQEISEEELEEQKLNNSNDGNSQQKQNEQLDSDLFNTIPQSTITESQFMQPDIKEIPNYATQYENLVSSFLTKANQNLRIDYQIQAKQVVKPFLNKELSQQDKQVSQNIFGNAAVNIEQNIKNQINSIQEQQSFKTNEVNQTEQVQEKDLEDFDSSLNHKKELRKCRIFGAQDFFSSEIQDQSSQQDQQFSENQENQSQDIKPHKQKQKSKNIPNDIESFEREDIPTKFNNIIKKQNLNNKKQQFEDFSQKNENKNLEEIKSITFNNKIENDDIQIEQDYLNKQMQKINEQQNEELIQTAHFALVQKYSNEMSNDENQRKLEATPEILEEPIESLIDDYPLLFQNASLQQLIAKQQNSSIDFQKTSKIPKSSSSSQKSDLSQNINQSSQKKQKINNTSSMEGKQMNSLNKNGTKSSLNSSQSLKKLPPKKSTSISQINNPIPQSQHQTSSQQIVNNLRQKQQSQIPIYSEPGQEKENQQSQQNSEDQLNSIEYIDQNEQISLQKTVKNTKLKKVETTQKPKIRSLSQSKNEKLKESEQIKLKDVQQSNQKQQQLQQNSMEYDEEIPKNMVSQQIFSSSSSSKIKNKASNIIPSPIPQMTGKKLSNSNIITNKKTQDK